MISIAFLVCMSAATVHPAPQSIDVDDKRWFELEESLVVVVADDVAAADIPLMDELADALDTKLVFEFASEHRIGPAALYIAESSNHASFKSRKIASLVSSLEEPGPQGYRLAVTRDRIVLAGADAAGVRYGLHTLLQLVDENGQLPCVTIRDVPALEFRAVKVDSVPSAERLRRLAAQKCNRVFFESDDFLALTGDTAQRWRAVFEAARAHGIEPVPMLHPLSRATPLLQHHPNAALGRIAVSRVELFPDEWTPLPHANVLETSNAPILVRSGPAYFVNGKDYLIRPGVIAAPFEPGNKPWLIRRTVTSAIPAMAPVEIMYGYVPKSVTAYCPVAPEAREAWSECLRRLVETLHPEYIHIGHNAMAGFDQDIRIAAQKMTSPEAFVASVTLMDELLDEIDPAIQLILSGDALDAHYSGDASMARDVLRALPKDIILHVRPMPRFGGGDTEPRAIVDWAADAGLAVIGMPRADANESYRWCQALAGASALGIVSADAPKAIDAALEYGWSPNTPALLWPGALNRFLGASLWLPDQLDVQHALAAHLNRQTLQGIEPAAAWERFEAWAAATSTEHEAVGVALESVGQQYQLLTDWVRLEEGFQRDSSEPVLREIHRLVDNYAELMAGYPADLARQIKETMTVRRTCVPSSILFGESILPFRPLNTPGNAPVLEVMAKPQFADQEKRAEANFDFVECPGPIVRVDADTVESATLSVETSEDGKRFQAVSRSGSATQSPFIFSAPLAHRYLNLIVETAGSRPVLREPRVFAIKEPLAVLCSAVTDAPRLDGAFRDAAWPREAQVRGFVDASSSFTEAQTTVRLCRTRDVLFLGIYALESRMNAMRAEHTQRDAPLTEEECVEIHIRPSKGRAYRFAVNPLGAQYDSRDGDASWNGVWRVATKQYETGWAAEIALPRETVEGAFTSGSTWEFECIRYRNNVTRDVSEWGYRSDDGLNASGYLIFE